MVSALRAGDEKPVDNPQELRYNVKKEVAGDRMNVSELIRTASLASKTSHKKIAAKMGWSEALFSNRLRRESFSADELYKIMDILGYDLKITEKDGNEVKPKKPHVGQRVQQFIDGYVFDTEKGDAICCTPKMAGFSFELLKDLPTGKYYIAIYCDFGEQNGFINPVTEDEAIEFKRLCNYSEE
mgnify:CR=1 FL=1